MTSPRKENPWTPGAGPGTGQVRVIIDNRNSTAPRTIVPQDPDFVYTLSFTKGGVTEEFPVENPGGQIVDLELGAWTLRVQGTKDGEKVAESDDISVNLGAAGSSQEIRALIHPATGAGTSGGSFKYDIIFSDISSITNAKLTLTRLSDLTVTTISNLATNGAGTLSALESGYYRLKVELTRDRQTAVRGDIVHIYPKIETFQSYIFTADDFAPGIFLAGRVIHSFIGYTAEEIQFFNNDSHNLIGSATIDSQGNWAGVISGTPNWVWYKVRFSGTGGESYYSSEQRYPQTGDLDLAGVENIQLYPEFEGMINIEGVISSGPLGLSFSGELRTADSGGDVEISISNPRNDTVTWSGAITDAWGSRQALTLSDGISGKSYRRFTAPTQAGLYTVTMAAALNDRVYSGSFPLYVWGQGELGPEEVYDWAGLSNAIVSMAGASKIVIIKNSFPFSGKITITGGTFTIIAAKPIVLIRASDNGPFFELSNGGELILGLPGSGGTLTLDGYSASAINYPIINVNGGHFTLNANAALQGNTNTYTSGFGENGGGAVIVEGGIFTMNGGSISGNAANETTDGSSGGGGVLVVNTGSFIMNGGVISGNTTNQSGGGVLVDSGSFTMNGGLINGNAAISKNTATGENSGSGGGVSALRGSFTINDGAISGNAVRKKGGGAYIFSNTFIMNGGSISGNTASGGIYGSLGGGIYVRESRFTLNDGFIDENQAERGGGIVIEGISNVPTIFTMNNGSIRRNRAEKHGGGIEILGTRISVTINGGAVEENTAEGSGGGILVGGYNASVTMNGGAVSNNTAMGSGGGILVGESNVDAESRSQSGTFTLKNGSITNNRASIGSAVYLGGVPWGALHIPSTANGFIATGGVISGNKNTSTSSLEDTPRFGVYIQYGNYFSMEGGFLFGKDNYFYLSNGANLSLTGTSALAAEKISIEPEISAPGTVLVDGPKALLDLDKFAYFSPGANKELEVINTVNVYGAIVIKGGE
ncbi:probable extracellular nuclease [Treponema primitia ZAS-2]|uniref:Probable extracellular nuclease n=1 Tax=Treponema primitia (strain ATCC BAA-887 / DSM 12427 / ZAS-2) TaxID=545694 RepID=F5YNE2_TREPZ|nr:probable extracellular nuclease [Treponema primitia ZAS-2]